MPLFVPSRPEFNFLYSNVSATRPATAWGFSHTSGTAPTFSAYATLVAAANITTDIFGIELMFNNAANAATTRNLLVNIGIDTAGGTTFTTRIPQLLAGHAGIVTIGGGISYYFPLYIPSGSSIGIQATGTAAIPFNTAVKLYGRPRNPDSINAGGYVINYGTTIGTGATGAVGTAITVGTTAEGAYTSVGTTTRDHWWWQMGHTLIDTNIAAAGVSFDMAAGSSITLNNRIFEDQFFFYDGSERIWNCLLPLYTYYGKTATGDIIYIRGQSSALAETSLSVAAWGLGG